MAVGSEFDNLGAPTEKALSFVSGSQKVKLHTRAFATDLSDGQVNMRASRPFSTTALKETTNTLNGSEQVVIFKHINLQKRLFSTGWGQALALILQPCSFALPE